MSWPSSAPGDSASQADQEGSISSENQIADGIATVDLSGRIPRPKLPCHIMKTNPATSSLVEMRLSISWISSFCHGPQRSIRLTFQSYALCRIGGLGKSERAMQFIAKRGRSFDASFFIPAESAVKIDDAFSEIAVELQLLSSEAAKDRLASKFAVLRWLFKPCKPP